MMDILRLQPDEYRKNKYWDFGNQILYDLCKDNFEHKKDYIILTKILFIGRIYAAALERRKNKKKSDVINDSFYINKVAPTFKNSDLDNYLAKLKKVSKLSADNIQQVLEIHYSLMKIIEKELTGDNKRSFSSKYLHFHLPNLFFIYDSRALTALKKFKLKIPKELQHLTTTNDVDNEYAKFFCKCFDLKTQIEKTHKTTLTNRQLDNILIEIANNR